jgi:hypothetical protein
MATLLNLPDHTHPRRKFLAFFRFFVLYGTCAADLKSLPYRQTLRCNDTGGEVVSIRVLVAFEDVYRAYREVIAAGIQVLRPRFEVTSTGLEELEGEMARLDPQVVVCSRDKPASLPPEVAWVKVPIDSVPNSKLTLEALLTVIDGSKKQGHLGG